MNRWRTENFQGSETILCDTKVVDTCHYTFVKIYKMYNTKGKNPSVKHGHWVVMCQCKFIDCNKCSTLLGGVGNGGS